MNYAVKISYLGQNYSGWQIQPDATSIQEIIENILFKIAGNKIKIIGAGRTDKGVNSVGQIASFEMEKIFKPEKLQLALNFYLPEDIRITKVYLTQNNFNARHDAFLREYKYFIFHGSFCPPALNNFVWWNKKFWDHDLARQASKILIGKHDFKAFCKTSECPENSIRTIQSIRIKKIYNITVISIKAQSFLTNMVRIIMGNLNAVATGKNNILWLNNLLNNSARSESSITAPACGLWFWRAYYKDNIFN